jgi:6-phosphogluconolactonase (cycloisomerase 2 family)
MSSTKEFDVNLSIRIGLAAGAVAAAGALFAAPAVAAGAQHRDDHGARVVFAQNDDPAGNTVYAYDRHWDGSLTPAGSYPTQGLGGVLAGSVVDHLASQGALTYDRRHDLLFAVNAGSNTVSVFAVHGDRLALRQVLPSGGTFPVSVTVSRDLVYVLNARDGGSVSGFRICRDGVRPIPGSTRPLGLDPTATPEFTHTPGQVRFTPGGRQLLVTTKANGNDVDVFPVWHDGRLGTPAVNELTGAVPFAAAFDRDGHLLLAEAGTNSVASFDITSNGILTPIAAIGTGQAATCWITATRHYAFSSNAGSASLTGVRSDEHGALTAVSQTSTDAGTVDSTATRNGHFLYVQSGGAGTIDGYRVNHDGTLTPTGTVTLPNGAGAEGIAAA